MEVNSGSERDQRSGQVNSARKRPNNGDSSSEDSGSETEGPKSARKRRKSRGRMKGEGACSICATPVEKAHICATCAVDVSSSPKLVTCDVAAVTQQATTAWLEVINSTASLETVKIKSEVVSYSISLNSPEDVEKATAAVINASAIALPFAIKVADSALTVTQYIKLVDKWLDQPENKAVKERANKYTVKAVDQDIQQVQFEADVVYVCEKKSSDGRPFGYMLHPNFKSLDATSQNSSSLNYLFRTRAILKAEVANFGANNEGFYRSVRRTAQNRLSYIATHIVAPAVSSTVSAAAVAKKTEAAAARKARAAEAEATSSSTNIKKRKEKKTKATTAASTGSSSDGATAPSTGPATNTAPATTTATTSANTSAAATSIVSAHNGSGRGRSCGNAGNVLTAAYSPVMYFNRCAGGIETSSSFSSPSFEGDSTQGDDFWACSAIYQHDLRIALDDASDLFAPIRGNPLQFYMPEAMSRFTFTDEPIDGLLYIRDAAVPRPHHILCIIGAGGQSAYGPLLSALSHNVPMMQCVKTLSLLVPSDMTPDKFEKSVLCMLNNPRLKLLYAPFRHGQEVQPAAEWSPTAIRFDSHYGRGDKRMVNFPP